MNQLVRVFVRKPIPVKYINLPYPKELFCYSPTMPWKWAIEADYRKEAKWYG